MSRSSSGSRAHGRIRALILVQGAGLLVMAACGQSPEGVNPTPIASSSPTTPQPTTVPVMMNPPPVGPTYTNPLQIAIPGGSMVETCADPAVIHGQAGDDFWYAYCTSDPLNNKDVDVSSGYSVHLIPTLQSADLVSWTYVGDAFAMRPSWAKADAGLWAPEVQFFNGKYYLYYTVTDTVGGGGAIGVATSDGPTGPWTHRDVPAVEPHEAPCCSGSKRWVFDPMIITDDKDQRYIYYGSYFGGISVRRLSADGFISDPASQVQITVANRYEAAYVVKHGGYYYLFGSATDCCNGPLSGYSVFAGRSKSPTGPFVDREGVSLLSGRVGGTPVLSMNGNRWVGPGHNAVVTDLAGQDWFLYHAIDAGDPYFMSAQGFGPNKRHLLMDALDWIDEWPTVRGGLWASATPQPAPATRPGDKGSYKTPARSEDKPGEPVFALSDEFDAAALDARWTWLRPPALGTFGLSAGMLRFDTQVADLFESSNSASILSEPVPSGDYLVEAKVTLDLPDEGCCYNFIQAGLVIFKDDDNFVKLVNYSFWDTRQIEFAKETGPVAPGFPRYGHTVAGAADKTVGLRIVRRSQESGELYTAYTSRDGATWIRGGSWTHSLGTNARIGLVAMGRGPQEPSAFAGKFDYVHVFALKD